jgi:hypothetical protein
MVLRRQRQFARDLTVNYSRKHLLRIVHDLATKAKYMNRHSDYPHDLN